MTDSNIAARGRAAKRGDETPHRLERLTTRSGAKTQLQFSMSGE